MISHSVLDVDQKAQEVLAPGAVYNMLWYCNADRRFQYFSRFPKSVFEKGEKRYKLMVFIHGTGGGDISSYLREMQPFMEENGVAVLAPVFPSGLIYKNDYNSYKLLRCDGVYYDLALLQMVDEFKERYPYVDTEKFFICGHSGGGQFVNRFLFAHPERIIAAAVSAPGRPTLLDFENDYFLGVRDFRKHFDHDVDLEVLRNVPVILTVGEYDNKYISEMPYGCNRHERLHSLEKSLQDNGVYTEFAVLPGIEHSGHPDVKIPVWCAFFKKNL